MSYHSTSEEQFGEIKEFLQKTWKIIVAVLVIGLIAIYGWRYWQSHKAQTLLDASDRYEQLIAKLEQDKSAINDLVTFAAQENSVYGVFADLRAAQYYAEKAADFNQALARLNEAAKKTQDTSLLPIIQLRIARVQTERADYDNALASLAKVTDSSWSASVADIKGDILVKQARYADAIATYEAALTAKITPELDASIKMKLNQTHYLQAKQQTATVPSTSSDETSHVPANEPK